MGLTVFLGNSQAGAERFLGNVVVAEGRLAIGQLRPANTLFSVAGR
jgi:hypothetical protein